MIRRVRVVAEREHDASVFVEEHRGGSRAAEERDGMSWPTRTAVSTWTATPAAPLLVVAVHDR